MKNGIYEQRRHSTEEIPYSFYECEIPRAFLSVSPHWHREFEINYVLEGDGVFRIDDREHHVKAGDIVFIQPERLHSVYSPKGFQIYNTLVFSVGMLSDGKDRTYNEYIGRLEEGTMEIIPTVTKSCPRYERFRVCIEKIFNNSARSALNDILVKSSLLEMIYLLIESGLVVEKEIQVGATNLKPVLKYINTHFAEELTIGKLAKLSNFSQSHFMAQFKRHTGMSTIEYINRLRIEKASAMLKGRELSVLEIATACGFKNISNFNRCFKKFIGTTPLKLRNK